MQLRGGAPLDEECIGCSTVKSDPELVERSMTIYSAEESLPVVWALALWAPRTNSSGWNTAIT